MGLKPESVPEKPDALRLYDQCKSTGLPLVAGGLLDQPHIWLMEYEACDQERKRFELINEANRRSNASQANISDRVQPN
jgi:hypothetical protein